MKRVLFWLSLVVAVLATVAAAASAYAFNRDIDAMRYRAQVAADATKMTERLDETLVNMERRGVTYGYAALIFTTPENDVALDYEALADLRDRAREISALDRISVEYQTALDDMRGTLREISIDAWYFALIRSPWYWLAWVAWILVCVGFFGDWMSVY